MTDMKKIKETPGRIGTAGLAAIMLLAQMLVTAFAEGATLPVGKLTLAQLKEALLMGYLASSVSQGSSVNAQMMIWVSSKIFKTDPPYRQNHFQHRYC